MRMAQQMAQYEWRDWIELNIFGWTSLLCCWVFWCIISWELREFIRVGVLGLCVFVCVCVCERERERERERKKEGEICVVVHRRSCKCQQWQHKNFCKSVISLLCMGEREPKQKPKLRHKNENKGKILCTSSNEQQEIYVHQHLVVTFSLLQLLYGPESAFIFFHPCCCFLFLSWDLVLQTSVKRQRSQLV